MNLKLVVLYTAIGIGIAQPAWSQRYSLNCEFNHELGTTKIQYIFQGSSTNVGAKIDIMRQINENGYPPGEWEKDPSAVIKSEGPSYFMADSQDGERLLFIEGGRMIELGLGDDVKYGVLESFGWQLCKSVSPVN